MILPQHDMYLVSSSSVGSVIRQVGHFSLGGRSAYSLSSVTVTASVSASFTNSFTTLRGDDEADDD
eukprot:scaffold134899_cov30-Cyclotella_meneghiniana.AAC.1